MNTQAITAIVLAGGDQQDSLAKHFDVTSKALIPLAGKPLAYYTLRAIAETPSISETVFVGPEHPDFIPLINKHRNAGESFFDSLDRGLAALERDSSLLLISADLPWLQTNDLSTFIQAATQTNVAYPVIPKSAVEQQFPRQRRDFVPLREGRVTGGSMMLVSFAAKDHLLPYAQKIYDARKSLLKMAKLLGFEITIRLLSRQLGLKHIEQHISQTLKVEAKAIMLDRAALAIDVDELTHLEDAEHFYTSKS